MSLCLTKPLNHEHLLKAVSEVIGRARCAPHARVTTHARARALPVARPFHTCGARCGPPRRSTPARAQRAALNLDETPVDALAAGAGYPQV